MGWESRGNGRYYYRKVRAGGRVRSEYLGGGSLADMYAAIDEDARASAEADRLAWLAEVDDERHTSAMLAEADRMVHDITAAVLVAAGYHTHRRQWRRQR